MNELINGVLIQPGSLSAAGLSSLDYSFLP
jgi:hypothetical protein